MEKEKEQILEYTVSDYSLDSGRSTTKCPYCGAYEEVLLSEDVINALLYGEKIEHSCRSCFKIYNLV